MQLGASIATPDPGAVVTSESYSGGLVGTVSLAIVAWGATSSAGTLDIEDDLIVGSSGAVGLQLMGDVVAIDLSAPTVEILNAPTHLANQEGFSVHFEFNEHVTGFDVTDLAVANAAVSNFRALADNRYTADITPNGAGDVVINVPENAAWDAGGNGNLAASRNITCGAGCDPIATVVTTKDAVKTLAGKQMTMITSQGPDLGGLFGGDGVGGNINGIPVGPVALSFSGDSERHQGGFSTSLKRFATWSDYFARGGESGGDASENSADSLARIPVNLWLKGRWSHSRENRGGIDEKSDFGIVHVGADYRVKDDLILGVMGQLDWYDEKSIGHGVEGEGSGWMLGPYLVAKLDDRLVLDLNASWGLSDNKINPLGSYWDSYEAERRQISANLRGSIDYGRWAITPTLGLVYFEETQKAYVDNNGFHIDAQTNALGSLKFGPVLKYSVESESGVVVEPLFGVTGVWDFKAPDINDVNGLAIGTEGVRAQARFGLNIKTASGVVVQGSYLYDGIGISHFESHSGELIVNVPLRQGVSIQGSYSVQDIYHADSRIHGGKVSLSIPF